MTAVSAPEGALRCPQCRGELGPGQDWCLRCGRAATTRIVRPRFWRIPFLVLGLLVALAGASVALLFLSLSGDDQRIVTTGELTSTVTITTQGPAATPTVTTTVPGTTAPGAAAPPAQTTPPATPAPTPTAPTPTTTKPPTDTGK